MLKKYEVPNVAVSLYRLPKTSQRRRKSSAASISAFCILPDTQEVDFSRKSIQYDKNETDYAVESLAEDILLKESATLYQNHSKTDSPSSESVLQKERLHSEEEVFTDKESKPTYENENSFAVSMLHHPSPSPRRTSSSHISAFCKIDTAAEVKPPIKKPRKKINKT